LKKIPKNFRQIFLLRIYIKWRSAQKYQIPIFTEFVPEADEKIFSAPKMRIVKPTETAKKRGKAAP